MYVRYPCRSGGSTNAVGQEGRQERPPCGCRVERWSLPLSPQRPVWLWGGCACGACDSGRAGNRPIELGHGAGRQGNVREARRRRRPGGDEEPGVRPAPMAPPRCPPAAAAASGGQRRPAAAANGGGQRRRQRRRPAAAATGQGTCDRRRRRYSTRSVCIDGGDHRPKGGKTPSRGGAPLASRIGAARALPRRHTRHSGVSRAAHRP